jgi:hypothetical protein
VGILKILLEIGGIIGMIVGIAFLGFGLYGLAGGTGVTFEINGDLVTAQEGGQVFAVAGAIILLICLGLTYFSFKRME